MNCWAMAGGAATTTADATAAAMNLVRIGISSPLMAGRKLAGATSAVNPSNRKMGGTDRPIAPEVSWYGIPPCHGSANWRQFVPQAQDRHPCAPHGLWHMVAARNAGAWPGSECVMTRIQKMAVLLV